MNKQKPNAQHGDEPKGSYLHIRVTREQKARWVKQAQARDMKLSAWVCEKLEATYGSSNDNRTKLANDLVCYSPWSGGGGGAAKPPGNGYTIDEVVGELIK